MCSRRLRFQASSGVMEPVRFWSVSGIDGDPPSAGSRDFYLIGSGFSRAVSAEMPTMKELTSDVLREMKLAASHLDSFGGDLEQWLSHLSTDQPWLSESENLQNRALFVEASEAITRVIEGAERAATPEGGPPFWLQQLAHHWRADQTAIATLNYDLLIEGAVTYLGGLSVLSDLYGASLEERHAPGDGLQYGALPPRYGVPTLFKLHGSRNWLYGGQSASPSERIVLRGGIDLWQTRPNDSSSVSRAGRREYLYDGLVPMVIPPTSVKNVFYRNLALRAQWRRASQRLKKADRLIIIGYSLPKTDLQMRQFIATSAREIPAIVVVDRAAEPAEEVATLLPGRVTTFSGDAAIRQFVAATCRSVLQSWIRVEPTDSSLIAELFLNQEPVWRSDPLTADDMDAARETARQEAERRWPGVRDVLQEDTTRENGRLGAEFALITAGA
jgi:hypothetical protein